MLPLNWKQVATIVLLGVLGWALCGAIMWVGMAVIDLQTTLILHALGAPVIFALLSLLYFTKFDYTTPLQTALAFFTIVVLLDFFVVALIINRSLDMFLSPLGTWIPFALIFLSTYLTGSWLEGRGMSPRPA